MNASCRLRLIKPNRLGCDKAGNELTASQRDDALLTDLTPAVDDRRRRVGFSTEESDLTVGLGLLLF